MNAWVYAGKLRCGYGVPTLNAAGQVAAAASGANLAVIEQGQPFAYACSAVEEVGWFGFECWRWLWY